MGVAPTAQVLVSLHYAGALGREAAAEGARWLRAQQEPDGSYRSHPTATRGDLGTTASAWAALHVCDPAASGEAIAAARAYIDAHGGAPSVIGAFARGDPAAVYLALAGLVDPSELPCPPMLPALVPALVRFMERRFHSGILMVSGGLTLIVHRLRGDWGADGPPRGGLARRFAARTLTLLATFHNRDGSWNANTVQTALMLPALRAAGLPRSHPMVARTVEWLEAQFVRDGDGIHLDAFGSPVWCTAANVRALVAGRRVTGRSASGPRARLADRGPVAARAARGRQPQPGRAANRRLGLPAGQRDDGRQRRHGRGADGVRRRRGHRRPVTRPRRPGRRVARPRTRLAARHAEPGRRVVRLRPRYAGQATGPVVHRPGRSALWRTPSPRSRH